MRKSQIVMLLLIVVTIFSLGCVSSPSGSNSYQNQEITPISIPTTISTPNIPPKYQSGDIVNDVKLSYSAFLILDYNPSTDSYLYNEIKKYQEGTWGFIETYSSKTKSRDSFEKQYMFIIGHVNKDDIVGKYYQDIKIKAEEELKQLNTPKYIVGDIVGKGSSFYKSGKIVGYDIVLEYTPESDKYTFSSITKAYGGGSGSPWYYYLDEYHPYSYDRSTFEDKTHIRAVAHVNPADIKEEPLH